MKKFRFAILLGLTFLCACQGKPDWHKSTFMVFDTVCEVNLLCSSNTFAEAQEEIRRIFSKIDTHFAPQAKDYASPWVQDLFNKALAVYNFSQGSFDITVAPLSVLWGFQSKTYTVPSPEAIQALLPHIGMEKIKIQPEGLSIPPGMTLDWGGIAKGFGIDQAAHALLDMGIRQGFINAGGDLYCWGTNPKKNLWQIGVKHPRREGFLGVFALSNLGAATTGDYQRFFLHAGERYHHVFDPKSGYPARGKQSVTVVGPETSICDALSTALFVSKNPEAILENYPEYGAVIVTSQGEILNLGKFYAFQKWD